MFISIALSGCYKSKTDLIGDRANVIEKIDSIIVLQNSPYYFISKGKTADVCELRNKNDLTACRKAAEIKVERLKSGNYLVQVDGVSMSYGLWLRSEPGETAKHLNCFLWLGDGVVGQRAEMRPIASRNTGNQLWEDFKIKLKEISDIQYIDRNKLDEIVAFYESVYTPEQNEWNCFGDRFLVDQKNIIIAGDNRHLAPFDTK
jgi:hypothetical protein